ncbi:JAB domain-containing protein [Flavobacterium sp. '19STA2R22 D10 B1']|uniref:JAB domain-containing protein n=1 Tax=Flavobacterium aerium TaxID=3037261 RepID=UPI00278C77BD|nr:JAB domain-containing protein [Flavobacterium sp. '19STA2R22 D10 B1']
MNVKISAERKINIANTDDVYEIMQEILMRENKLRRAQEHFWAIGIDDQNRILFIELISLGSRNRVNVDPPQMFRMGIYKLATKMILVHNHPSGNLKPSDADKNFTDRMLKAGRLLLIEVIDHMIISETGYCSFEELGFMNEFRNNGLYELIDQNQLDLNKARALIEKENILRDNNVEIAKKLKGLGMDNASIKKATGLSLADIKAI